MKRLALLIAFFLCSQFAFSQWQSGFGGLIYYNGGNVGIGTLPVHQLHVGGNTLITTKLGIGYVGSGLLSLRSSGGSEIGITQAQLGGTATMELTTKDGGSGQATRILLRGNNNDADIEFYTGARGQESQTMIIGGGTGNVGIGVTPTQKLHVNGSALITSKLGIGLVGSGLLTLRSSGGHEIGITQGQLGLGGSMEFTTKDGNGNQATRIMLRGDISDADIEFFSGASGQESQRMIINGANGNVGIGTNKTNDGYKLSVNGSVRAEEVKVYTGWADYVFSEGYELPNYTQLREFIETNHHLPGLPSEEEIEKNGGIELGNISTLQQEKIEELFLYVLQLEERIRELESK